MYGTYFAGGALTPDHASYVRRAADGEVLRIVMAARKYFHIIAPRQMGKTSLLRRLAHTLAEADWRCGYVDLSSIRSNDESEWYSKLGRLLCPVLTPGHPPKLGCETDLREYLLGEALVQGGRPRRVVLLFDEVGALFGHAVANNFFMMLRTLFNERGSYEGLLVAGFVGTVDTEQLVDDENISPFNVSEEVPLEEFTSEETGELTARLARPGLLVEDAARLSVYEWTRGHPYLSQRLCLTLAEWAAKGAVTQLGPAQVDEAVREAFLNPVRRDSNVKHVLGELNHLSPAGQAALEKVVSGAGLSPDTQGFHELYLTGLVKVDAASRVAVRNRIYERALSDVAARATPASSPAPAEASLESDAASRPQVNTPEWPRKQPFQPRILIMKGGGVKGIAYVGALKVLEAYGYKFQHFVGASAGAITAALLSAGYTSTELGDVLAKTNLREFKDGWLPLSLLLLPLRKGLYKGESFRVWLEGLLRKKFPRYGNTVDIRFSHLSEIGPARRLTIFTSIKGRRAYPFDSGGPAKCDERIAFACRCSMAIPYFFIPEKIGGERVVDGGMQNNYPVYALLATDPALKDSADFLGLYLGHKTVQRSGKWLFLDLFSIWGESGDEEAKEKFFDRTIVIDPRPIKTTDFSLTPKEVQFLLAEGRASALHWLHYWADGKRPTLEEVSEAESASAKLRTTVIAERWRRFWPKLAASTLLLVVVLSGLVYGTYQYVMRAPSEGGTAETYPAQTPPIIGKEGNLIVATPAPTPCGDSKESENIYERKDTSGVKSLDDKVRLIYIATNQIFKLDNTDYKFYCGGSAFAIPNRDGNCTVTLGIDLMNKLNDSTPAGEARIYFVVAQEMAHCMQIKKKFTIAGRPLERETYSKIIDLHADFLAGWAAARFLKFGENNQLKHEQAFFEVINFAFEAGDMGGQRGSPRERHDAARAGFDIENESDPEKAYQKGGEYLSHKYTFINNSNERRGIR